MINIFDELNRKFDLFARIYDLSVILCEEKDCFYINYSYITFEEYFNKKLFRKWKHSKGYANIYDFRCDLGIMRDADSRKTFYPLNENEALKFLQYIRNIFKHWYVSDFSKSSCKTKEEKDLVLTVNNSMTYIMDKIGQKFVEVEDGYDIIVPCNEKTKCCAEKQENVDIAMLLYEYTSILLKENKSKKLTIIRELANFIEPIIKKLKSKFGNTHEIYKMCDNLSNMLNNTNIRHNNLDKSDTGKYRKALEGFKEKDFIRVYDACYDIILNLIMIDDYLKNQKDIENILKLINLQNDND